MSFFKKKQVLIVFLLFFFAGFFIAPSFAQTDPNASFRGEVYDVDPDTSEVIVKRVIDPEVGSFEEVNCVVTSDTKITKNGHPIDMNQLFPGDQVSAQLGLDEDGQKVLVWMDVTRDEGEAEE